LNQEKVPKELEIYSTTSRFYKKLHAKMFIRIWFGGQNNATQTGPPVLHTPGKVYWRILMESSSNHMRTLLSSEKERE
jgi:hypothetical protein